jgi:catechol 2,3-dioxygenase-like lactoylglutathione lyase family enzyme
MESERLPICAAVVPELDVTDLDDSLRFYRDVLGFSTLWSRPEERFAFLEREQAQLMLQEARGPGRRLRTAELVRPFGRGINLQIAVSDVNSLYAAVVCAGGHLTVPLERRSYRVGSREIEQRQFVVADPDGYLLRFFSAC